MEVPQIHTIAFMLVHAVQLLLFAPVDWVENRIYSRDVYDHRFPLPYLDEDFPEQPKIVRGLFTMGDLSRALYMLYSARFRRGSKA